MIKRIISILSIVAALFTVGCKQHTIIPDDELALIFHDVFLTNSYLNTTDAKRDSLLVYEPIFERYGYTAEDVQYTIGNFSKRKSARLGDVVEQAIDMLEQEGEILDKKVEDLDTLDNVARRSTRSVIFRDSMIKVTRLRDTAKLRITIDSIKPGDYHLEVQYEIDSLDENKSLRAQAWIVRKNGIRNGFTSTQLRRKSIEKFERTMLADSNSQSIVINFWEPINKPRKRPSIKLHSVTVTRTLPTEEALDSLYKMELDIRLFANDFLRAIEADSLTLPADSTGLAQ
ncbi:MAG: DUF4296 domain-containing protein [Alistipes sp.]|nr:DUF4296 domain-containing protein [Alistipes sp.]